MNNGLNYFSRFLVVLLFLLGMQNTYGKNEDILELIEMAGEQERLSQQIAKNYFYIKESLLLNKAETELAESLNHYKKNRLELEKGLGKSQLNDMFGLIDLLSEDFLQYATSRDFSVSAAAQVLEMSEAITEAYADMSKALESKLNTKQSEYILVVERQEMQIEQLAKYYVAYTSEFSDHNTALAINDAVRRFQADHSYLKKTKSGNPAIDKEIKKIDSLWKLMKKYYTNVEQQQLPVIVLVTTNKILASIEEISDLYLGDDD